MEVVRYKGIGAIRVPTRVIFVGRKARGVLVYYTSSRCTSVLPGESAEGCAKQYVAAKFTTFFLISATDSMAYREMEFQFQFLTALQAMATAVFVVCFLPVVFELS